MPPSVDHDTLLCVGIDRQLGRLFSPLAVALCRACGSAMSAPKLDGLTFLVVEDEPLIAMDVSMALEDEGAKVTTTTHS